MFADKKCKILQFLSTKVSTNRRIRHWHCWQYCPTIVKFVLVLTCFNTVFYKIDKKDRVGVEPTTSAGACSMFKPLLRGCFCFGMLSYFPSAALSSGVSSLSECDPAGVVVLLVLSEPLFFSFCSECVGCPVRISFAISCGVSFPCSSPSVAESLRWVDTATAEMTAAMVAPEINKMADFLFISTASDAVN